MGCGRLSQRWRTATVLAGPLHLLSHTTQSHLSTIKFRERVRGAQPSFRAELRVGLERNRDQPLSGDANSYWRKKLNFAYRLSVIGIRRAAGNGLGRGRPTRERGQ